jgi:oligopeptide transport system permease protein
MSRAPRSSSLWADAWRRLRKNRMALICGWTFLAVCAFCFVGPPIIEWTRGIDPTTPNVDLGPAPPSWTHWFGTDALGRDLLVRTMIGGRIAIGVGMLATMVAIVVGVSWGAIAAYAGGKTDEVMMRIVDILYGFPRVVFIIVISSALSGVEALASPMRQLFLLFALIGAISWLNMARIVRGQVLSLRNLDFVDAARAIGAPGRRIVFKHIVPNTLGLVIVYATLSIPGVMLTEAFLSFLGIGVQAPLASWGTLVTEGATQIAVYPWTLIAPGLVMSITIFSLNFLGDGLRDALDPQMRKD